MAQYLNKNSQYIGSLTDFILDTKPYHSKLTEIVEEYQFYDEMAVKITERNSLKTKIDPVWLYNYYSSGDPTFRTMGLKQLHVPLSTVFPTNTDMSYPGAIRAFRDENTDLASVPYVYSKKAFDGIGVLNVFVERSGVRSTLEPLTEGLDYFQSHGSFQFQIKQTSDPGSNFVPSWTETRNENVIATASAYTKQVAEDLSNPYSACSQVKGLLLQIQGLPLSLAATTALNDLLTIVNTPALPRDYEPLLNQLTADGTPVLAGYTAWLGSTAGTVQERFSQLTPSMYFNVFSDADLRESGQAQYENVFDTYLTITNITASAEAAAGDTWYLIAQDDPTVYSVFSSVSGYIGAFDSTTNGVFSTSTLTFTHAYISTPAVGYTITIKNRNRLVFGQRAPLETWNIIKVNPIAYTRPVFLSTRYGYIQDLSAVQGRVTLLDTGLPTSTVTLTAHAGGQYFDLTSDIEPLYTGLVQVGIPFNDGRLGFTIVQGSVQPFVQGDKFYIAISNEPAKAIDLDLGYGYDLDSYDNQNLPYDGAAPGQKLNFAFDTRYTDYNLANLNLTIAQNAVPNRKWRIVAMPDMSLPIATLKKDGSTSNVVDVQAATDGIAPDPALNAAAVYETIGGAVNFVPDLRVYYATFFEVTYSDDDFTTVTSAGYCQVGSPFVDVAQGISFTLAAGSKPFIGVRSDDGIPNFVEGGDVFSFQVQNAAPVLVEQTIGAVSASHARLVMHGDGFHEAPPAHWAVTFTSPTSYTVTGILTEGTPGFHVPNSPANGSLSLTGSIAYEGNTWNALGVHFTIVPGAVGFAAGDKFTFDTFSRKPSYLVHGSVSGWQKDAVVGEPYWNDYIGFTIQKPTAELFNQALTDTRIVPITTNTWSIGTGQIQLTRLRFDAPSLIYTLVPTPVTGTPTGWYVTRSDIGAVGYLSGSGTTPFSDTYVTIALPVPPLAADIVKLQLEITADDFTLWNAQDTVLLRPVVTARLPTANDFVLVDKGTEDRIALNLRYDALGSPPSLAPLAPYTIDQRFVDLNTNNGQVPLANTSPETALLTNWIPLKMIARDSSTSVAETPDVGTSFDLYALGSGQKIGTLSPTTSNPLYPMQVEWYYDPTDSVTIANSFFTKYLPLNAEANLVTYGSGFNDLVHARISETLNILTSGGALSTDFLFSETVAVRVDEHHQWNIVQAMQDLVNTDVNDGPFGGFLSGYDNQPYDDELHGYDTGIPLTDNFMEARQLAGLDPMTPKQLSMTPADRTIRLNQLLGLIDNFLNGTLAGTTLPQFLANVEADPIGATLATTGFGTPAVGMGMDITIGAKGADTNNPSTEGASAGVQDALVIMAIDPANTYDVFDYDIGGIDQTADRTAIIFSGALPPVPTPLPGITTYAEFETPLAVVGDPTMPSDFTARVFEINFRVTAANLASIQAMPTPKVFVWLPTAAAPQQVSVVEKIGTGKYRIAVPASTEAKLYLQPGP